MFRQILNKLATCMNSGLRIRDNYSGRRVHKLPEPVVTSALRLVVETTHGTPEARVFEIRAY